MKSVLTFIRICKIKIDNVERVKISFISETHFNASERIKQSAKAETLWSFTGQSTSQETLSSRRVSVAEGPFHHVGSSGSGVWIIFHFPYLCLTAVAEFSGKFFLTVTGQNTFAKSFSQYFSI